MPIFVRKILIAKWSKDIDGEITADAVTACLKTFDNTLSLWKIDELNLEELEKCVLALATSENVESLNTMAILCLDEEFFATNNLVIKHAPDQGKSHIGELNNEHFDILNLNYSKLKIIGNEIKGKVDSFNKLAEQEIENNFELRIFKAKKVKEIVKKAIDNGRLNINSLHPKLQPLFI